MNHVSNKFAKYSAPCLGSAHLERIGECSGEGPSLRAASNIKVALNQIRRVRDFIVRIETEARDTQFKKERKEASRPELWTWMIAR